MRIRQYLLKFDNLSTTVLLIIIGIFVLLRIPSLIEPLWYGDEGIYDVIGMALREGRSLYTQIWDNKPPGLYLIYAAFGTELFFVKLFSLITGVVSVIVFYILSGILKSQVARFVATGIFAAFFGLPVIEGNIANAENFMLLPTLVAFSMLFRSRTKSRIFLAGIFLSLSFLIKTVAIFDVMAVVFILIVLAREKKRQFELLPKKIGLFCISFLLLPAITFLYFLLSGSGAAFIKAVFLENVGYVGEQNQLLFPMDILLIKVTLLAISVFLIYFFSKRFQVKQIIIYSWLAFSIFNVLFSQRPYIHYVLLMLPSAALFAGYIFDRTSGKVVHIIAGLIILVTVNSIVPHYEKTIGYYENYIGFVTGNKSLNEFRAFFDQQTVRDYEVARVIESLSQDKDVFIWSDSGQIYSLIRQLPPGKYIVAYHVLFYDSDFSETESVLKASDPSIIIQTTDFPKDLDILSSYRLAYKIQGANIYEKQY